MKNNLSDCLSLSFAYMRLYSFRYLEFCRTDDFKTNDYSVYSYFYYRKKNLIFYMPSDVFIDGARSLERIHKLYALWHVSQLIYRIKSSLRFLYYFLEY